MQLAKQGNGTMFVSSAVRSLQKVQETAIVPLPIVSTLLAQTEGSFSQEKWEQKLGLEWFTWSPGLVHLKPVMKLPCIALLRIHDLNAHISEASLMRFFNP